MNAAAPRVLVVGAGGLGCPALLALAPEIAARGGLLGVIDDDRVELSNLNRQILHRTEDVGRDKAKSAQAALLRRHPRLRVEAIVARVGDDNANEIVREWDVVVDGSDSFASKFLLNDACVRAKVPLVHGGVVQLTGQLMSIVPGVVEAGCFRCLFEAPPPAGTAPSCAEAGVVGAFAGIIGALQAKEALAIVNGAPELAGTLLVVDGRSDERRRVRIRPRPGCEAHLREVA